MEEVPYEVAVRNWVVDLLAYFEGVEQEIVKIVSSDFVKAFPFKIVVVA